MVERFRQLTMHLTPPEAREVSRLVTRRVDAKKPMIDSILKNIAQDYGLASEDLLSSSRRPEIIEARHVAVYFLVMNTELSLRAVAVSLGRTNNTTVLNSLARVQSLMAVDPDFKERIESHPLFSKLAS